MQLKKPETQPTVMTSLLDNLTVDTGLSEVKFSQAEGQGVQASGNSTLEAVNQERKYYQKWVGTQQKPQSWGSLLVRILLTYFSAFSAIAILAVLALPSFLDCSSKAKESEGKQTVAAMNRTQQAVFEENGAFANSIDRLGTEMKPETTNYKFSVRTSQNAAFNYGISQQKRLKSYVGGVFLVSQSDRQTATIASRKTTTAILCVTQSSGTETPAEPRMVNGQLACGSHTVAIAR